MKKKAKLHCINLSYDGVFKTPSYDWGAGAESVPLFLFVKKKKKVIKNMHCVDFFFFLSGSFKDKAIFQVIRFDR